MKNEEFDIAVVGSGCAGFQLLHELSLQPDWKHQKVALFSDEQALQRSWCFWAKGEQALQHLITKSWQNVTFKSANFSKTENIAPYKYHYIAGETFFNFFKSDFMPKQSNVEVISMAVQHINKNDTGFYVMGKEGKSKAQHVFSSLLANNNGKARFHLWQHFQGWFVKTDTPTFDDSSVVLMDFSIPQSNDVRFVYILPFSPYEALVEMTVFSAAVYADATYQDVLTSYMNDNYPAATFTIEATEKGQIPMTDAPFSRLGTAGEVLIGSAAGMIKASTGYAFKRIGRDCAQLAANFKAKKGFEWLTSKRRFKFYDRLLLGILTEEPTKGSVIFSRLFQKMPIQTVLRFLDEETNLWEELKIFAQLPYLPFLNQIARQWTN
ncbi:MAG: lycopene cyclase family protein [Saprospiraceae bacterium]|nr:lycopene cyclase family protein [Saprospiraceae bacterium]